MKLAIVSVLLISAMAWGRSAPVYNYSDAVKKDVEQAIKDVQSQTSANANSEEILKAQILIVKGLEKTLNKADRKSSQMREDGAREHLLSCLAQLTSPSMPQSSKFDNAGCEQKQNFLIVYAGLQENYDNDDDCKRIPVYVKDSLTILGMLCKDPRYSKCYIR